MFREEEIKNVQLQKSKCNTHSQILYKLTYEIHELDEDTKYCCRFLTFEQLTDLYNTPRLYDELKTIVHRELNMGF